MDINLSHNEIQFYYGTTHNIHIDLLYISVFTRDINCFWWDEILRDPISFETGLKHIFIPQKNIETGVKYFFYLTYIYRTWLELVNFVSSRLIANYEWEFFQLGWDFTESHVFWNAIRTFFISKKYKDGSEIFFFYLIYIYGTGLGLINHIPFPLPTLIFSIGFTVYNNYLSFLISFVSFFWNNFKYIF